MSYDRWFKEHGYKHRIILEKLKHLDDDEIIKYFRFENMVKKEPDFCPLYKDNKKCHNIELLNCYLCACPNFRFSDSGFTEDSNKVLYSYCNIDSKDGDIFETDCAIHQNCSNCLVPHDEKYIKKYFSRDWFLNMRDVNCN
jgi:hypothetical protein